MLVKLELILALSLRKSNGGREKLGEGLLQLEEEEDGVVVVQLAGVVLRRCSGEVSGELQWRGLGSSSLPWW